MYSYVNIHVNTSFPCSFPPSSSYSAGIWLSRPGNPSPNSMPKPLVYNSTVSLTAETWRAAKGTQHSLICLFYKPLPSSAWEVPVSFVWFNSQLIQTVYGVSTTVVIVSSHNMLLPKSCAKTNEVWHFQLFIKPEIISFPLKQARNVTQWLICQTFNGGKGVLIIKDDCSCRGVTNWFMMRKTSFYFWF